MAHSTQCRFYCVEKNNCMCIYYISIYSISINWEKLTTLVYMNRKPIHIVISEALFDFFQLANPYNWLNRIRVQMCVCVRKSEGKSLVPEWCHWFHCLCWQTSPQSRALHSAQWTRAIKVSAAGLMAAEQQLACFPVLNCGPAELKLLCFAPSTDSSAFIFQRRWIFNGTLIKLDFVPRPGKVQYGLSITLTVNLLALL